MIPQYNKTAKYHTKRYFKAVVGVNPGINVLKSIEDEQKFNDKAEEHHRVVRKDIVYEDTITCLLCR